MTIYVFLFVFLPAAKPYYVPANIISLRNSFIPLSFPISCATLRASIHSLLSLSITIVSCVVDDEVDEEEDVVILLFVVDLVGTNVEEDIKEEAGEEIRRLILEGVLVVNPDTKISSF